MKNLKIICLLQILFFLTGCVDKPVKTYPLTIVITDKIGTNKNDKYPDIYSKFFNPLITHKNVENNFAPYPIIIKRLGIDNGDVRLDVISDERKSNTNNLNYRRNMVIKFFDENTIGSILSSETPPDFNKGESIANFTATLGKKSKIFYCSQNSKNDKFNNDVLYDNYDSLVSAIASFLSENSGNNIFIIMNPESMTNTTPTIRHIDTTAKQGQPALQTTTITAIINTTTAVINTTTKTAKETETYTGKQATANSLSEYFQKLADKNIPYRNKEGLKKGILSFFTSADAEVTIKVDGSETGYHTIKDYAESLSNTYRKTKIENVKTDNSNKISIIYITEQ